MIATSSSNGIHRRDSVVTDREPPQSLEAEQGVLGSVLIDPDYCLAEVRAILAREDFYLDVHALLWDVLCRMYDRGDPIDALTVSDRLTRDGTFGRFGGDERLTWILQSVPNAANARYYAGIVRDRAEARRLIDALDQSLREAYDGRKAGAELLETARARIERLACGVAAEDLVEPPGWPDPIGRAAYRGCVGAFVDAILPHSEADPAALLLSFLTAAGNLLGPTAYALAEGTRHRCNLYLCLVGDTSKARKGTSVGRVKQALDGFDPGWIADRVTTSLASGEGLVNAVRDDVVDREGEVKCEGVVDKRLLVIEEEFGGQIAASNRDGSTLTAQLRKAWDSTDLRHLTRHNALKATGAHVSMITHITLHELDHQLKAHDQFNGFANRILWCCVRRSKLLPHGGTPGKDWARPIVTALAQARAWLEDVDQPFAFDPDARELWGRIYEDLSTPAPGLLGAVTSRGEAQVLRLALLYAALEPTILIGVRHLEAAREVWRYCEDSARHIFHGREADPDAEKVLRALEEAPAGLIRSQITLRVFQGNRKAEEIDAVLTRLIRRGSVRCVVEKTGGRSARRWVLTASTPPTN